MQYKNYVNVNVNVSVGTTICSKRILMLLFCRVRFSQCIDIEIYCNINHTTKGISTCFPAEYDSSQDCSKPKDIGQSYCTVCCCTMHYALYNYKKKSCCILFAVTRSWMNMFRTVKMDVINECSSYFDLMLPSELVT